jgi:hypothetical protein
MASEVGHCYSPLVDQPTNESVAHAKPLGRLADREEAATRTVHEHQEKRE